MTLDAFISLAQAANLDVRFAEALPYGGWGPLRDIGFAFDWAGSAHAAGEAATEEEGLDLVLETALVVAVSKEGARTEIKGAWSATGFALGNRTLSLDEAYERVFAG
jgi:hypothetical protein